MSFIKVVLSALVALGVLASAASGQDFTGRWSTNMGDMTIQQNGASATGTYSSQGVISGTVTGAVFSGSYVNGSYRGEFSFTLAPDGRSFSGRWWRPGADESWTGTRIGEPPAPAPTTPAQPPAPVTPPTTPPGATSTVQNFAGQWDTSLGILTIEQIGARVTGSYGEGKTIEGTVSGRVLNGTYVNGAYRGNFEFTLAPNGQSFTGRWWRPGAEDAWNGTRISAVPQPGAGGVPDASAKPGETAAGPCNTRPPVSALVGPWRVEDATNGRNHDTHPVPWVFGAMGTVSAEGLWQGTWTHAANGGFLVEIRANGGIADAFLVCLYPDGAGFTAYRDGHDYRYGYRALR